MDRTTNRQVGEFVVGQEIGAGNSATVYRAYQPTINRYVALKLLAPPYSSSGEDAEAFERRFTQEAQTLASLEHPHIVPIYHYGMVGDGSAYIAMRLMRESLNAMLAEGPVDPQRVMDIALQLIEGLSYAHKKGVLHQDIKPENILFDEAGSACLSDFGLTRMTDRAVELSRPNFVLDTAMYVSPEQIRSTFTDPRSDIYSLGVVMYQMLTGNLPFEGGNLNVDALLRKIELEEPISPRKLNSQIAPELERIVLQALRNEPRERFFDVGEMARALEAVPGTRAHVPRPTRAPSLPARRKSFSAHRLRIRAMAVLVVVGVFILSLLILNILRQNGPSQHATIETAASGSVESIVPSEGEIAQAKRMLGSDGFIAYIACAMDSQFQSVRAREMSDEAQADGLGYRVYDSNNDDYKQLTLIEQARLEGAKAIILCPLSPNILSESLTSVENAEIPLVLTDTLAKSYGGVMLTQDDHEIGLTAGRFVGQSLIAQGKHSANVLLLDAPDYPFSEGRAQGFLDGLAESIQDVKVAGRYATGVNQAASQTAVAKLVSGVQQVDAIFSVTDTGAYGAIAALSAAQIAPDAVIVASVNAESVALDHIARDNYLRASVDIGLDAGSRGAFAAAVKLLGGGTLPQRLTLPPENLITHDIVKGQSPSS